ncbi:class I SAM-dependent methyltransferase [Bacillus sp. FJAT-45037]|uniref:class I SAM-dependent methyltransferase n=1 Tax=Bacillus sp. FJAT-45037 TaxID=2011007 RepID=UPI000C23F5D9|nr:class I SAM-dependent methyltransferase [Bacillus sp. FJAT-45037]
MNNFQEYEDPLRYDKENEGYYPELSLLSEWASKGSGPIINLACGTGRTAIPLAKQGFNVMGVDLHRGMLEHARAKSTEAGVSIQWVEQDCTTLDLDVSSHFIYLVGNSFQHFHSNESQDCLLKGVRHHLKDGGVFIFGTRFPSIDELFQPPTEQYWKTYNDPDLKMNVELSTLSTYDPIKQLQHYTTIRKYKNSEGKLVEEKQTKISLRYVFPQEMVRLLSQHGFEIVHSYRNWHKQPLHTKGSEMIYVCMKS